MRPDQIAKLLSRGDGLTIRDGIVAAATHFESYCAAPNQERSAEDDGIDPIVRALTNLLGDPTRDGELRGGAAWALGKCLTDQSARVLCAALLNRKPARDADELYQILIGMDNFLFSGRRGCPRGIGGARRDRRSDHLHAGDPGAAWAAARDCQEVDSWPQRERLPGRGSRGGKLTDHVRAVGVPGAPAGDRHPEALVTPTWA